MTFLAILAIHTSFAQKSKNTPSSTNSNLKQTTYTCSMHPEVVADKPGKCPKCDMDLVASKEVQKKKGVINTYTCSKHPEVVSDHPGVCHQCKEQLVIDRKGSKQASKVYTCSMHPDVTSDKAGKCPKCNMNLTEIKPRSKAKKG